jgi:hypothetical protein
MMLFSIEWHRKNCVSLTGALLIIGDEEAEHLLRKMYFLVFFLCLSRACLGKMIVLYI